MNSKPFILTVSALVVVAILSAMMTLTPTVKCHSHATANDAHHHPHVCGHDKAFTRSEIFKKHGYNVPTIPYAENHEETVRQIQEKQQQVAAKILAAKNSKKRGLQLKEEIRRVEADEFQPIRITFITSTMNANDGQTCLSVGQRIQIGSPSSSSDVCSQSVTEDCWATCSEDMVVTSDKLKYMNSYLLPNLKSFFEKALTTRRLKSNLRLGSSEPCGGSAFLPSGKQNVEADKEDLIVLVTLRPQTYVLGYAFNCQVEPSYRRPVIGQLNLNPMYMDPTSTSIKLSAIFSTAQHELTHLLGFSQSSFNQWYDSSSSNTRYSNPTGLVTKSFRDSTGTLHKIDVMQLRTPEIVAQARTHFNCPSLNGVDLEEFGGDGSRRSHLEARLFMNELMTASDGFKSYADEAVFSQFTFAALEDSGWYRGNWSMAKNLLWGKNAGCSMVNDRCEQWALPDNSGYFCSKKDNSVRHCNFEHTTISYCGITSYSSALEYYEHLAKPTDGGLVGFMDYCPFPAKYSNLDCRSSGSGTSLEAFGPGSACFNSNLQSSATQSAKCFKFSCNNNQLQIIMGGNQIECPADQTYRRILNPNGVSGYVDCPLNGYDILCGADAVNRESPANNNESNSESKNFLCRILGIWCNSANSVSFSAKVSVAIVGGAVLIAQF